MGRSKTNVASVKVQAGETIDFIVDCRDNDEFRQLRLESGHPRRQRQRLERLC